MALHYPLPVEKVGAIIFARYDSKRLHGKLLLDIAGQPLLSHVLQRIRQIKPKIQIVLATTKRAIDAPLINWAKQQGISTYCGELKNVTARAVSCAENFDFSSFIRVCADRPFFDPSLNAQLLETFRARQLDLATNSLIKSFPIGAMAEVVRVSALKTVLRRTCELNDLEHVTRYIYRYPNDFQIENLCSGDRSLSELSIAIDTREDLERTRWVFQKLKTPSEASFKDVISLTRAWELNSNLTGNN